MTTIAAELGRFVAGLELDNIPAPIVETARCCLLNAYGMALAGRDTPYAPVARAAAIAMDGIQAAGATLLGDGRRSSIGAACLANAALFHGRTQEDTCGAAHFGTVLIPLLTALIEARRYPLDEFLPALVAGYEAGGALERALVLHTNPAGFRSTAVFGTIAASAAASRLLRLSPEACAAALANAASFAGGLLQSFADGSDEWRYQVGVAARNGWLAAELAAAGSVTAPRAFEGDSGFARAFARVPADATAITARLGQDWAMTRVTFKPYPVCAFNQTPVGAALVLREELGGALIDAVRVRMNPFECNYAGMDSTGPFYSIAGTLMSIPFCIATTLVHGAPDMRRMATYDDAAVNTLLNKVQLIPSPEVPTLCAAIEIDSGARRLHRDERKTARDYAYDRTATINLIRRTCAAENVPLSAVELVERFVDRLPNTSIDEVLSAFTSIEPA